MNNNMGKSHYALLTAILVIAVIICAGVGYTVYNQTVYNLDTDDMKVSLDNMQGELQMLKDSVSDNLAYINNSSIESDSTKEALSKELITIDQQIIATSEEINKFNEMLNQSSGNVKESYNELIRQYDMIVSEMNQVLVNVDSVNRQLEEEINYLSEKANENHIETINALKVIHGSLSSSNDEFASNLEADFKSINSDFKKFKEENQENFSSIETLINETNTKMDKSIVDMQGNVDGRLVSISDTISSNNLAMTDEITNLYNTNDNNFKGVNNLIQVSYSNLLESVSSNAESIAVLENKIDQVFTSASEGKKLLAETLTGKGIDTANDAYFSTINENINALYLKGVEDGIAGVGTPKLHYEYHYHEDRNGVSVNAAKIEVNGQNESIRTDEGGCFQKASHRHVDGSGKYCDKEYLMSPGGCYQKKAIYSQTACGSYVTDVHEVTDRDDQRYGCYCIVVTCLGCRESYRAEYADSESGAWANTSVRDGMIHYKNIVYKYEPNCSRSYNCYEPVCGFKNGDIERAIIDYK